MTRRGDQLKVGEGGRVSTVLPDLDFETYSEAGYYFDYTANRWRVVSGKSESGLAAVGMYVYAEHPSTEILSAQYDLKDGLGGRLWLPGYPPPQDLFDYVAGGGLLESWNDRFEFLIWNNVAVRLHGWPPLPAEQQRDAMAKARAFGLPGALDKAGAAIGAGELKDKAGGAVMRKLSKPRNPTKKDISLRHTPASAPDDFKALYIYGMQDIVAESSVSAMTPDLTPNELQNCLLDHRINQRGVHIDRDALDDCAYIVRAAIKRYTEELADLTAGVVTSVSQVAKLTGWVGGHGYPVSGMTEDDVTRYLADDMLPPDCRRALEIRRTIGGAAVKKLFAIERMLASDGRLHDLYVYHGAHTGRAAGRGPQPTNIPGSGPKIACCESCGRYYAPKLPACPGCGTDSAFSKTSKWKPDAMDTALIDLSSRSLDYVETMWPSAFEVVTGCLRGLFCAAPGHELICSDYSSIEAVVLAALAGEEWRLDVFRTHGRIYEVTAEMITGVPMTDDEHPHRKKGKFGELASGYQGWIGAWLKFGAGEFMSEDEIKAAVLKWRAASPMIVELWGGQHREIAPWQFVPELYGLEGAAVNAVLHPGRIFTYRSISYGMKDGVLYCRLPTGRCLTYHSARLREGDDPRGNRVLKLSYMGWGSVQRRWCEIDLYGGRQTENIVQAVARDIQAAAMRRIDPWAPIVLHVYDEIVSEMREGTGDVMLYESQMAVPLPGMEDWPIKASGGWIGKRFRKG